MYFLSTKGRVATILPDMGKGFEAQAPIFCEQCIYRGQG